MNLAAGPYIVGFFFVLLVAEAGIRRQDYVFDDSIANLTSGLTLISIEVYFRLVFLALYDSIYREFALFSLPGGWIGFGVGLLLMDLAQYVSHYVSHHSNFFWAAHIGHHQSESFNLSVSTRVTVPNRITYAVLFMIPALIGVPTVSFFYANLIGGIFPFWYHTQMMKRLGPLEWIIVTPSHHRVHHGTNDAYLDRNYAGVFSFWDRLFGTFAVEKEAPRFGILKTIPHHRVGHGYFLQYRLLFATAARARDWRTRLQVLFGSPGNLHIPDEVWARLVGEIEIKSQHQHPRPKIIATLGAAVVFVFALLRSHPLDELGRFQPLTFVYCVASVILLDFVSSWVEENVQIRKIRHDQVHPAHATQTEQPGPPQLDPIREQLSRVGS